MVENPQAVWVQTAAECVERMREDWDEIHLDHDLGGKTFVDVNDSDCGMEVIRWLCKEPRPHLRETRFFIHTHNTIAGILMVLQMHACEYHTEFRPFGIDPILLLRRDDDELLEDDDESLGAEVPPERPAVPVVTNDDESPKAGAPPDRKALPGMLKRLIGLLRGFLISS